MSDSSSKKRLGRGLAALIGDMDVPAEIQREESKPPLKAEGHVPIEYIGANKNNPRLTFDESELAELAQSIKEHGLVQPVVVRTVRDAEGRFEIIAGERRWRAAQLAGLTEIPVIIREVDDKQALELAIIENVQRSNLNAVEEAKGYEQLMDEHGYTQNDLAQVIGKSRSHVANTLRLLKLPGAVRSLVSDGQLSAGHARTLVGAENPLEIAHQIIDKDLSVRQAEALAHKGLTSKENRGNSKPSPEKDADTRALEKALTDSIGLNVAIDHRGEGGEMRITYRNLEQLDDLCRRLNG